MEPYPARADADHLAAVGTEQAARFRDALRAAGFAAAAENLPMEVERRARGGRNIPRMMRMTTAGTPLDASMRIFLMGVPTGVREARAALDRMKDDSGLMQCKLRMAPGLALETTRTWSGEAWSDAGYWLR